MLRLLDLEACGRGCSDGVECHQQLPRVIGVIGRWKKGVWRSKRCHRGHFDGRFSELGYRLTHVFVTG